jgi:cell division protein FtsB
VKNWPRDKTTLYRNGAYVLILICVVLIVHEIFGQNGYLALRRQRRELEALHQQIDQLRQQNEKLEQQIKALKSDPQAIERLAREQMHLARPGELIYTLPKKNPKKDKPSASAETPAK